MLYDIRMLFSDLFEHFKIVYLQKNSTYFSLIVVEKFLDLLF